MRLVLLGPPGAGKGTQAMNLVDQYDLVHVSTGDLFRANIKNETELGKQVQSYLSSGKLVPDELTIALVWDRLDQDDTQKGFLLDGFPRTIAQAEALDQGLEERGMKIDAAVCIDVPSPVLVERLAGRRVCPECGASYHIKDNPPKKEGICDRCGAALEQRKDDTEETVKDRIDVYHKNTEPLIDFYQKQGKLMKVNGNQGVDQVSQEIYRSLDPLV